MARTTFSGPVVSPGGFQGPVTGGATNPTPTATTAVAGLVKQGVAVPNAVAAPTQAEFNALLASLRTAGVILP